MDQAGRVEAPRRMGVLRMSLPIAHVDLPPQVVAISRWLPGALVAAWVLTLPLEFTKVFFPNQGIELSRVVLALSLLVFAAQVVFERREIRVPASASVVGLALFTAYAAASAAVFGSSQGIKTVLAMVAYLLMMLTIFNWMQSSADHRRIWSALAVSVLILAAVGLILHATNSYIWNAPRFGIARLNATFHDPNIFARYLAFGMLTMVLLVADLSTSIRQRALWVGAALAAALIIPFTYSRASWLCAVVAAVVVIVVARRRRRALALVAMVAAAFGAVAIVDPSVFSRAELLAAGLQSPFSNGTLLERAPWLEFLKVLRLDSVRQFLVGAGLIMFVEHPIFGIGFGAFSQSLLGPYASLVPLGFDTTASHTSMVTILAESGLVGLAIVLLTAFDFVRSTLWARFQSATQRTLVLAPVIGLLVITLESQFSGRLFDEPYLWLFLGLAYSAQAGWEED